MAQREEIRVFLSSPGDCEAERLAVSHVLDEMNRTVGERERLFFQLVRWEDFAPGLGSNPQAVIDVQLGGYDVLVGVMWMRFGTPIPGGAGSGTEHEVQQAIQNWTRIGEPHVMFYFKLDPPQDLSMVDPSQFAKVQDFRGRLQAQGLVQTFHGTVEFESKLRVHLYKLVEHLRRNSKAHPGAGQQLETEPYDGFYSSFREVVAAQRIPVTGAMLHVVFGNIAEISKIPVVIPAGQTFDFVQRGPQSVLASFETIRVNERPFFDYVVDQWPVEKRPRAAGLGHTKYLTLPQNTGNLPGVFFVVTTRDFSAARDHYGIYANTPIEGIDFILDRVIEAATVHKLTSLALPLLGAGYANIRATKEHAKLGYLLKEAITLLTIEKLRKNIQLESSSLRRAVVVVYSQNPQGEEEHALWASVTRFLGSRSGGGSQVDELLREINSDLTRTPIAAPGQDEHETESRLTPESLCMGCMESKRLSDTCPKCGWVEGKQTNAAPELPLRTMLNNRYLLGRVLGRGGFGITYLAWDLGSKRKVAVKEYFPAVISIRAKDRLTVTPLSSGNRGDLEYGLGKFVEEGKALARFKDQSGVVSMIDFFYGNGTAYIVMAYLEGRTLKEHLYQKGGKIPFTDALGILSLVMNALEDLHKVSILHRDINLDNIYVEETGGAKILDFGATRYAMGEQSRSLSVVLKPGYAPEEQYRSKGKQGPWTDVYALAATFYRAITGQPPPEAPDRIAGDALKRPSLLGVAIPPKSEAALMKALAVRAEDRFQTVADFQNALGPEDSKPKR